MKKLETEREMLLHELEAELHNIEPQLEERDFKLGGMKSEKLEFAEDEQQIDKNYVEDRNA